MAIIEVREENSLKTKKFKQNTNSVFKKKEKGDFQNTKGGLKIKKGGAILTN